MRISGMERAEVTEPKEKWKCNKRGKTEYSRTMSEVLMKGMLRDELKWEVWKMSRMGPAGVSELWIQPTPLGKKKRKESRDIDLALFMLNAIGSGTRCFTLCLHREAAMRPKKRKHNQEGSLFVVCSGCESESVTACVSFGGGDSPCNVQVI